MLPTKGYFQDIECPYYDNVCNRPYCHFRHRKKTQETIEEVAIETTKESEVPTYKPTPKSELANIKSHIPISYVPDLAFRSDRTIRPLPKFSFEKPTYKPTPLSILSSANKRENGLEDDEKETSENIKAIREIKQNIANVEYNPEVSMDTDINFEDLSAEFDLLDDIIEEPVVQKTDATTSKENNVTQAEKTISVSKSYKDNKDKQKSKEKSEKSEKHSSGSSKSHKSRHHKKDTKDKSKESSRDKYKEKEIKSDRNKEKERSSRHRSKHKSSKDKHRSREKERTKSSSKSKERDTEKRGKEKRTTDDSNEKRVSKSSGSSSDDDNEQFEIENFAEYSDVDLEDEDTLSECYKIFSEYEAPKVEDKAPTFSEPEKEAKEDIITSKKRVAHSSGQFIESGSKIQPTKSKVQLTPAQMMSNRFKLAKLAQADNEQKNLMNEVKQVVKRPAPSLLEAARTHKLQKISSKEKPTENVNLIDSILNNAKNKPKKIAPVQNVNSIQRAKARIEEIAKQRATETLNKTPAQTIKGNKRVAHVPEISLSDIPDVLNADKSKLPINVRTRFLTMIADECVKLYLTKEDAYNRALNEEFGCYEKCKVLLTYKNSAMLAVNRLRKELQEREKLGLGPIGDGESSGKNVSSDYQGKKFYDNIKHYILTNEELDIHGYPKESTTHGRAVIKNRKTKFDASLTENQRKCIRCSKIYSVDDDGFVLYEEECIYHPLKKRTLRGEQTYLCCKSNDGVGCVTSNTHVSECCGDSELEGFQTTMKPESDEDPRSYAVYALDCEMCYTIKGLELTRVTIVDSDCKTVYESLVKPLNPIIDYNTTFSGITKDQMERTSTSILQVQANILHLCNSNTILIGHSLESDMKALKIVHGTVIDTSVLFPHKMGLPHKRALKVLASEFLKKIIQNNVSGHDSAEDAITCMELVKWKLKEELKLRGIK